MKPLWNVRFSIHATIRNEKFSDIISVILTEIETHAFHVLQHDAITIILSTLNNLGVCKVSPHQLNFDEFDEISDVEDSTWVLSGSELFFEGAPIEVNYPLDLDSVGVGSSVGVMVRRNGELHYFLNGEDMGRAARDVPDG